MRLDYRKINDDDEDDYNPRGAREDVDSESEAGQEESDSELSADGLLVK